MNKTESWGVEGSRDEILKKEWYLVAKVGDNENMRNSIRNRPVFLNAFHIQIPAHAHRLISALPFKRIMAD